ncbi:MAG: ATP-binding cassette domain-containing protein [Bryobacterales bacterium]|nr:ATP-binding cassette domain-containing protein [Acidobacteriota bacterium]MCB9384281.1 ATP-binding cassette domain-containing protein [Bryobacterales bacterium]
MDAILSLDGFGLALGDRVILSDVRLDVPTLGVTGLLGPCGSGKSSLLRTIAGLNRARPALQTWGAATFAGKPLGGDNHPTMITQDARLLTSTVRENIVSGWPNRGAMTLLEQTDAIRAVLEELGFDDLRSKLDLDVIGLPLGDQRRVALVRAYSAGRPMICLDEPDANLAANEADGLLAGVALAAKSRAILWVTHNQRLARENATAVALLAGGRVLESGLAADFFAHPATAAGDAFLRTGGCPLPSPMAKPEDLEENSVQPPPLPSAAKKAIAEARSRGPRDFFWLLAGQLGGLPRPGIMQDLETDLDSLRRLGITTLVTLEESVTVEPVAVRQAGLEPIHFPIDDMRTPSLEDAVKFCRQIEERISRGESIALHCRAGMGRTGLMLASQLIWRGLEPLQALETVREINPRWIQSDVQVDFLADLARYVSPQERVAGAAEPRNHCDKHTKRNQGERKCP